MYIGSVQRAVGGRVGFLIIRESLLFEGGPPQSYIICQCVGPKEVNLQLGKLGNRLGDFIEEAVRPSAVRLFRERGIDVHEVHQKIDAQRGNEGVEVDLLVVNDTDVIAIECKSNLSVDDVKDHLERLSKIKRMLPTYADKRIMGAVAAMVIPDAVALYAYRHGLFVIGQNGEQLHIRNKEGFNPAVW